jgi:Flp pilus assembly protein TadG
MSITPARPIRGKENERGSIVIMTALSMLLLLLMVGLCIDVSRIYAVRAELQNAADAAALTAAAQLNGGAGGIDNAVARANAIVNTQGFGNANVTIDQITFAVNLYPDSAYMSAADARANPVNIRFVKVLTQSVSTGMLFASRALGGNWSENRQAVAGNSGVTPTTICDFFPAAVALLDTNPAPGTLLNLTFNQGTGQSAVLADKDYIILEVPDINGNGNVETALLTGGLPNYCKTLGDNINMTPSSNQNNGPKSAGDGSNTRFNDYANGYGNQLQPNVFHPDSNIQEGITHQQYVDKNPITPPTGSSAQYKEDDRRMLIMPIILPNGPPPLQPNYPAYTTNIQRWGLFFLKNKSLVIQGGGCSTNPLCGALQVEVVRTVGPITPSIPTATSSSLTLPVIYR